MKYTATLPDDSVNVSKENPLFVALKLTLSLVLLAGVAYVLLGFLMNILVASISPEYEKKLMEFISVDVNITQGDSKYLNTVTQKLKKCTDIPYDIGTHIMEDSEPNAFAMPGGAIYITRGMIAKLKSENELAFIIGHELGHFKNKDHLRMLGHRLLFGVVGILLGSDYGAVASTTLSIGSTKYSQKAEYAADIFGLEVMNCAYGSVTDATKMFERMDEGDEWKYFIATHPGFKSRVEKMKEKIAIDGMDTSRAVVPLGKI